MKFITTSTPFEFVREGDYLTPRIIVSRGGEVLETIPLYGPGRRLVIADLIEFLGNSKATKLVAWGQAVENETWR